MTKTGSTMATSDAARIQAAEAKQGDGGVKAGGFAARAQASSARYTYAAATAGKSGETVGQNGRKAAGAKK